MWLGVGCKQCSWIAGGDSSDWVAVCLRTLRVVNACFGVGKLVGGLHKCSHALQSVMYFRGGLSVFKWRNYWIGVLERSSGR